MKHDKLVRDKIPEIIKKNGEVPVTRIANNEEYWLKLKEKLKEEVDEFHKSESKEEIADILEVISAICDFKNIDKDEIEDIRKKKQEERGSFKEKIILEQTNP